MTNGGYAFLTKLYSKVSREVDHDSALERLVEDLMSGSVRWSRDVEFTAVDILEYEDIPGFDSPWHFICRLLIADAEKKDDLIERANKQARSIVTHWCRTNDYGIDLWRRYCEPEEEC